jgi:hypothetical protein
MHPYSTLWRSWAILVPDLEKGAGDEPEAQDRIAPVTGAFDWSGTQAEPPNILDWLIARLAARRSSR